MILCGYKFSPLWKHPSVYPSLLYLSWALMSPKDRSLTSPDVHFGMQALHFPFSTCKSFFQVTVFKVSLKSTQITKPKAKNLFSVSYSQGLFILCRILYFSISILRQDGWETFFVIAPSPCLSHFSSFFQLLLEASQGNIFWTFM